MRQGAYAPEYGHRRKICRGGIQALVGDGREKHWVFLKAFEWKTLVETCKEESEQARSK